MSSLKHISTKSYGQDTCYVLHSSKGLPVLSANKLLRDKYTGNLVRKIGVSLSSGCLIGCIYCFTRRMNRFAPLSSEEIVDQVKFILEKHPVEDNVDEVKISMKQMGDPLLNQENTLSAIRELHEMYPSFNFVVSTSGYNDPSFFDHLNLLVDSGINIRLQFSCHTTSDEERNRLHPEMDMMKFSEIAETVRRWQGDRVTLNFVLFGGLSYDFEEITKLFPGGKVFIKLNYVDPNEQTKAHGLVDVRPRELLKIKEALKATGLTNACRH